MNIFILDEDPVDAAIYLCDKHIVKMALETAQILSTVNGGPYKVTHENHPCVKWAGECLDNYKWTVNHGKAICKEYGLRFFKTHKSEEIIYTLEKPLINIQEGSSKFVQCMPEQYKQEHAVYAYRNYYINEKLRIARWSVRPIPYWVEPYLETC